MTKILAWILFAVIGVICFAWIIVRLAPFLIGGLVLWIIWKLAVGPAIREHDRHEIANSSAPGSPGA